MRAGIYLLEADGSNLPVVITLVTDGHYRSLEHLREIARVARAERYVYRPGILFACVDGQSIVEL